MLIHQRYLLVFMCKWVELTLCAGMKPLGASGMGLRSPFLHVTMIRMNFTFLTDDNTWFISNGGTDNENCGQTESSACYSLRWVIRKFYHVCHVCYDSSSSSLEPQEKTKTTFKQNLWLKVMTDKNHLIDRSFTVSQRDDPEYWPATPNFRFNKPANDMDNFSKNSLIGS